MNLKEIYYYQPPYLQKKYELLIIVGPFNYFTLEGTDYALATFKVDWLPLFN